MKELYRDIVLCRPPSKRPKLKYNQLDEEVNVNRASYTGIYKVQDGLAL